MGEAGYGDVIRTFSNRTFAKPCGYSGHNSHFWA
nr:MAG TPA: hypothetical protein [Caudoviricetes sp.]